MPAGGWRLASGGWPTWARGWAGTWGRPCGRCWTGCDGGWNLRAAAEAAPTPDRLVAGVAVGAASAAGFVFTGQVPGWRQQHCQKNRAALPSAATNTYATPA